MNAKWKTFIICIAIPLGGGILAALLTRDSMEMFAALNKPVLSPPGWLFPVVWTILYVLMGIASYLIYTSEAPERKIADALVVYGIQLIVNFFWPIFFFNMGWYLFSFWWLVLLGALILVCIAMFERISRPAAYLMVPYLLWVTFAGYLNYSIYILN